MFHFVEKVSNTFLLRILADLSGFKIRQNPLKSAQIRPNLLHPNPRQKNEISPIV
jgi:hypothetical protein